MNYKIVLSIGATVVVLGTMIITIVLIGGAGLGGNSPGDRAADILRGEPYSRIEVEVDYVQGQRPSQEAIDTFELRIEKYTAKNSVTINIDEAIPSTESVYTLDDVKALEKQYRDGEDTEITIFLYFIFLDGEYVKSRVLGVAYSATSAAIFEEKIDEVAGDTPSTISKAEIETAVIVHEWGHLLGLVEINYDSSKRGHDDGSNHCPHTETVAGQTRKDCVMADAVDTVDFFNQLEGDVPTDFAQWCHDDLDDIRAGDE